AMRPMIAPMISQEMRRPMNPMIVVLWWGKVGRAVPQCAPLVQAHVGSGVKMQVTGATGRFVTQVSCFQQAAPSSFCLRGLPCLQARPVSVFSTYVGLAGGLSKLAPALARMVASQRAIRRRACPPRPRRRSLLQLSRPDEAALQEAETAYLSRRSLKAIAKEVGTGHERLSRLLHERGVRLRNQSPTREETAQMKTHYT